MKSRDWFAAVLVAFVLFSLSGLIWAQGRGGAAGDRKVGIDITNYPAGTYELTISDSGITIVPLLWVNPGTTIPPVNPDPSTLTERGKRFRDSALAVGDQETGRNLMALYVGIVARSKPPNQLYTTTEQLEPAVFEGFDLIASATNAEEEWAGFRRLLNNEWNALDRGEGSSFSDFVLLVEDCSAGLSAAVGGEGAAFDITVVFKILDILGDDTLKPGQKGVKIAILLATLFAEG